MSDTPPKAHKIRRPFVYVPAVVTDIRETFALAQRRIELARMPIVEAAKLAAVPVLTFPTKPKE